MRRWLGLAGATTLLLGCGSVSRNHPTSAGSGGETAAAGASATGSAGDGGQGVATSCDEGAAFAKARLWRIIDAQYVNAVRQLFGVTLSPGRTEPDMGFELEDTSEHRVVSDALAASYRSAAQQVAAQAVETHYESFMPCGDGEACAEQLVRNRIARAFGRRLDETEVARYLKLFRYGAARSPQDGVRLLIEATLQSPSFLYRSELGPATPGGPKQQVTLTPHETATLLAYSFTSSLPDDELWEKADTGELADPAVLAAQVTRLLELDETHEHLGELGSYWLGMQRVKTVFKDLPEFPNDVRASLFEGGRLFARDLLTSGSVNDVVTSRTMYLNESLAKLYGIAGVSGPELRAVQVDGPDRSAGILTQPALLAGWSHLQGNAVVQRGLFAYNALVCGPPLPPPGPDVNELEQPEGSEREQATFRLEKPSCAECHRGFDPLGLLNERYDSIGRYDATNDAGPIDQSAVLEGLGPDLDGPTDGLQGLSEKLTQGRRLSDCAAKNLAGLTLGHAGIAEEGSCAFEEVKESLATSGQLRDFFQALATSRAFIKRDAE